MAMYDIAIIGGGLAGLTAGHALAKAGFSVILFEQGTYPQERVCGEYISEEVRPYLEQQNLFPDHLQPAMVRRFQLSLISGKDATVALPLGGFGLSRGSFDQHLCRAYQEAGGEALQHTRIVHVQALDDGYLLTDRNEASWNTRLVVGAWGKRSVLDTSMARSFTQKRAPYVGVKYHIRGAFDLDTVGLHVFAGGYCGISPIEKGKWNLCYLVKREQLRKAGSIPQLEVKILCKNPQLKHIWATAEFLLEKPLVINEISFQEKTKQEAGMLMLGDAAGLISPLCGNGMAMAIHSGALAAQLIQQHWQAGPAWQHQLWTDYQQQWHTLFADRMRMGRILQPIFLKQGMASILLLALKLPYLSQAFIRATHGKAW